MQRREYIVDNRYAVVNNKGEVYPDAATEADLYTKDAQGLQRYARNLLKDEYYAIWNQNTVFLEEPLPNGKRQQKYAKNHLGDEVYPDGTQSGSQQFFATDSDQSPRYAKRAQGDEYYPVLNQIPQFIVDRVDGKNKERYAKDSSQNEIYPKINGVTEITLKHGLNEYYAKNKDEEERVPKDRGVEYQIEDKYPIGKDGRPFYLKNRDGDPVYPIDPQTGDELYLLTDPKDPNRIIFGTNAQGTEKYAKDASGNEYYPPTGQFAKENPPHPASNYAYLNTGKVIYPKNPLTHDEMYIYNGNGDDAVPEPMYRYAKWANGGELYPRQKFQEMCRLNRYAKDAQGQFYYPADENGNEYMREDFGFIEDSYPITTDQKIIVPSVAQQPHFTKTGDITKKDIKGVLHSPYQDYYRNYLTDKISSRTPRFPFKPYRHALLKDSSQSFPQGPPQKPQPPRQSSYILYIIVTLLILLVVALVIQNFIYAKGIGKNKNDIYLNNG